MDGILSRHVRFVFMAAYRGAQCAPRLSASKPHTFPAHGES